MKIKISRFLEIEDIAIKVTTKEVGAEFWKPEFYCSEYDISGRHIRCNDLLCRNGGAYITDALDEMVKNKQTEFKKEIGCRGSYPSGRWCPNRFKINIVIKYKERDNKEGK
jgi:hypothetical protein